MKQLGVLGWWSPFILIIADVALTSGSPVDEYRSDGPEGMPLRGPMMIDLAWVPATQDPSSPMMVCTTKMVVVTAATDGGLLSPLVVSPSRRCSPSWDASPEY